MTVVSAPTASFGPGALALTEAIDALLRNARERIIALGGVEPHAAYGAAAEELTAFSGSVDLLIGSTDILFAFDSIPAVFGITEHAYIVFAANAFALLGLRPLFFLVSGLLVRLVYMSTAWR